MRELARERTERFEKEKARAEGGRIGNWLGTRHQLPNLLAIVTIGLLGALLLTVVGTIYWHDLEYFKTIGVAILGWIGTIIGYLVGSKQRS